MDNKCPKHGIEYRKHKANDRPSGFKWYCPECAKGLPSRVSRISHYKKPTATVCPKHGVEKVWRVNSAKKSGGQYICPLCLKDYKNGWYVGKREEIIDRVSTYQQLNPEAHNKANRAYQKTDKGKLTKVVSAANRRTKLSGRITKKDIQVQYELQKGRCYYCSDPLTRYHVDHVVPVVRGGSNTPDNIVIACPTCNLKKGSQLPCEWLAYPC